MRVTRSAATDKEALRQQMLLRALLGDARPGVVAGWLRDADRVPRGLAAYRANVGALAERALAAVYPTVQQLVSEQSFAALARAYWRHEPPLAGDIALWGGGLADFIADAESLADEPCLPDVARLEWAVHGAERAADAALTDAGPPGLALLATVDPARLRLRLAPGTAVLDSLHPVAAIWHAHRSPHSSDEDRYAPVRAAYARGGGEQVLVARAGWPVRVQALDAASAAWTRALLAGRDLAAALQEGGAEFDFEAWLIAALQTQLLVAVTASEDPA